MFFRIALVASSAIALSGCAVFAPAKGASTAIAYKKKSSSQMFIWHSDYNSGIYWPVADAGSESKYCVQGALTARATNADINFDIDADKEVTASAATALNQVVTKLNPSNAQVSYVSSALYALCQMSANGDLSEGETSALFGAILTNIKNVKPEAYGSSDAKPDPLPGPTPERGSDPNPQDPPVCTDGALPDGSPCPAQTPTP